MNNKTWTDKEKEILRELWGYKSIEFIAKKLDRTETGVHLKAKRMKLGRPITRGEYLNANQASVILNIDRHVIVDNWIKKRGLKAKYRKLSRSLKNWLINYEDLINWLKDNQDKWDSRRIELFALGTEPDWLTEKRKKDKELPKRRFYKWTKQEDARVIYLFKKGLTYKEISKEMNRSKNGVKRRLSRLDIWGDGSYKGKIG